MIFDYIEKAYYINLDYRTDRKELFEKRVGELNIPVERFAATKLNPNEVDNPTNDSNWHGKISNYNAHTSVIRKAKDLTEARKLVTSIENRDKLFA